MFKIIRTVVYSCVLLMAVGLSCWGQISSSSGAVEGTVTDPQKAVIPGAKVILTNADTGTTAETTSGSDGTFVFPLLAPGNYNIQVQAAGFETTDVRGVR